MSNMRREMCEDTDARICVGGALSNYKGFCPGIIEEASLAIKKKQPLYLVGAFGGATSLIIRALKGEDGKKLTNEIFERYHALKELYEYIDNKLLTQRIIESFSSFKKLGLVGLSRMNGLSKEENAILFNTIHFPEMIYYILIGLMKKLVSS
jgi:hypothetical protein